MAFAASTADVQMLTVAVKLTSILAADPADNVGRALTWSDLGCYC